MIVIPNLKLAPGADEAALKALAAKALKIPVDDITGLRIRKNHSMRAGRMTFTMSTPSA